MNSWSQVVSGYELFARRTQNDRIALSIAGRYGDSFYVEMTPGLAAELAAALIELSKAEHT